ncbi:hypothetical protein PC123_g11022 [Phytophthora cactorum]|nr:hypothetical protein PC123_g11022 [Phytophthora cactorum]
MACDGSQTMKLTEVYYAEGVVQNLISYGRLEEKGYASTYKNGHRDVAAKDDGRAVFDVDLRRNVLVVRGAGEKNKGNIWKVIMAVLEREASGPNDESLETQKGTLVDFHKRLGHLNYKAVERLVRDPSSGSTPTDHRRVNCLTSAQGKQTKTRQLTKATGTHAPIDRIGGVICSDLKGPMTPRDRLGNRYMINFVDHRSNYCRVFLAKTNGSSAKQFEHFLVWLEAEFDCRMHALRTDSGGE